MMKPKAKVNDVAIETPSSLADNDTHAKTYLQSLSDMAATVAIWFLKAPCSYMFAPSSTEAQLPDTSPQ